MKVECQKLLEISEDMRGRYFNGTRPLSKENASIISANQDAARFSKFIESLIVSGDAFEKLVDLFDAVIMDSEPLLVKTDAKNYKEFADSVWEQFYSFIEEANSKSGKERSAKNNGNVTLEAIERVERKVDVVSEKITVPASVPLTQINVTGEKPTVFSHVDALTINYN